MAFGPRNAYYLRISTNIVLPLYLYLDERHIDWMSDVVLQHILADLRPLVIPRFQAEMVVHPGPGAAPGSKRGTVEVHRGETYQFAYFFRKTESHTVLFKSRYFVTATPSRRVDRSLQKNRLRADVSAERTKRKRAKTKGKNKISHVLDVDEWSAGECEEVEDADPILREPRPLRKRRHITGPYQEDNDNIEDTRQDIAMTSPSPEDGGSARDPGVPDIEDEVVTRGADDQPSLSPDTAEIEFAVEEEEKPKPFLKLKYQSFPISGYCLCVVVEPWPPLRAETARRSVDPGALFQREGLEPSSNGSVVAKERAKTPLFLPEYDRALSEAPFERGRTLPSAPLFHDARPRAEDGFSDDLINFSQALNTAGHMHAITVDDDDDMDGAVLFGDADEIRELF